MVQDKLISDKFNELPDFIKKKVHKKALEPISRELKEAYIKILKDLGFHADGCNEKELSDEHYIMVMKSMIAIDMKQEIIDDDRINDKETQEILAILEILSNYIDYKPD